MNFDVRTCVLILFINNQTVKAQTFRLIIESTSVCRCNLKIMSNCKILAHYENWKKKENIFSRFAIYYRACRISGRFPNVLSGQKRKVIRQRSRGGCKLMQQSTATW